MRKVCQISLCLLEASIIFFFVFLSRIGPLQSIASPAATCVKSWSRSVPWVLLKQ